MKIILNPEYEHLREFVESLPEKFNEYGGIIQDKRNIIKVIEIGGIKLNIKRYRKPIFINRIVYSYFRNTKASKAYFNALKVIESGFDTPAPIAYIEEYNGGLLSFSFFISLQLENYQEIRDYYFELPDKNIAFFKAFANYTAQLHEKSVLHLDYSPGNILIKNLGESFNFSLVDINRMKFQPIDMETGCANFQRLFEYDETFEFIAREYALSRNFDPDKCVKIALKYKHEFEHKKERKVRMKKLLGLKKK